MIRHGHAAFLFANGLAAYFNPDGQQMPLLQAMGWAGLTEFRKRYPDGEVELQGGRMDAEAIDRVIAAWSSNVSRV